MTAAEILLARDVKRCVSLVRMIRDSGASHGLCRSWQIELETIKNRYGGMIPQPQLNEIGK